MNADYLRSATSFLHSIKWIFCTLNTQYLSENVIIENREFVESLAQIDLSNFPELESPLSHHPECLQRLIEQVNKFKIAFDTISTELTSPPIKKLSRKKQYEIENVSKVIDSVCRGKVTQLVDCGSGLGYLGSFLFDEFGYSTLGLEGCSDNVEKAEGRQKRFHPKSLGKVKHVRHFITLSSADFILDQLGDYSGPLAIFGLHGCGDLTVTAINLFLDMDRVKSLIFMPCCYHKMTPTPADHNEFNFFPLSSELKTVLKEYPPFLNRPFLRLAGQQSPAKWKEMSEQEHWLHGKNMFERALAEALLADDETIKRINNINFLENRVTMDDIVMKYQLIDKSSGNSKPNSKQWTKFHFQKFLELREKYSDGEEMSENLFCLQTTIQSNCENLVLIDRIRYIQEQGELRNLKLEISVKKLQNDKLTPRCLILIVEKL